VTAKKKTILPGVDLFCGDATQILRTFPEKIVQCCITSPPYWGLRDYGVDGQLGLESTSGAYVAKLVDVLREVWRVLRDDGTLWLNLGDSYAGSNKGQMADGHYVGGDKQRTNKGTMTRLPKNVARNGLKPKDLVGIPWRVAFALQADGWYLRSDIIWAKPNPMPESVTDRPTKSHEYVFLLAKQGRYYYDAKAIKEPSVYPNDDRKARSSVTDKRMPTDKIAGIRPGSATYATRNRRSVWTVATSPYSGAHFATFPPKLIEPMILAGCPADGVVLDPFCGSGTTGAVAVRLERKFIGIDLKSEYIKLSKSRIIKENNK